MHRVTCLFVVIITLLTVCHGYSIEKIVGGFDAQEGDFPYQVSLRRYNMHLCGGSIVNELWILTAAHCVSGQNAMWITVVAGTNLLSEGGDSYQAEKLIAHKKYDPFTIGNDIALVRLASSIVFGPKVQPVGMPFKDSDEVESDVILSGWGRTSYPGGIPDVLQRINLRTISGESCKAAFSSIYLSVRDSNICTLTQEGEGACHGDSGGPLTTTNGTQIGIVSWGMPCAKGYPDVYTRVASFTDWIEEKIEQ